VLLAGPHYPGGHPGDRSRPIEHAAATCHTVTGPSTPTARTAPVTTVLATSTAASTSRHVHPLRLRHRLIHLSAPGYPQQPCPHRAQPGAHPAQPTPHRAHRNPKLTPNAAMPPPPARATSAAPNNSTAYARRSNTVTGNNT
jgi:hypothetical protein